mmetsp:Transcript_27558/g.41693  ORF Transcript_27558/g.41693 Transcript_27558/m.41693 type:complete len:211 (-) Transcript_27558:64-696(-)|eukprot:CAMPEP_0178899808 /NCGR_PEP_ID=MMETSP0786-20121207/3114_1 /TAXON_ID=186022 /ORGANISM="Thalassionema frauenfeldii, Strain CCMP 1798" /LENGTH=210 /DNA_ID=CAMNT_0020570723 /DNA_START=52 /DNA_END=684 /DNA_ORIENTATION=+
MTEAISEETPTFEITLPTGRLHIALADQRRRRKPVVSTVMRRSFLYGKLKPGYIFQSLTLGDGSVIECNSCEELVAHLDATMLDPNRKVKVEAAFPDRIIYRTFPGEEIGMYICDREDRPTLVEVSPKNANKEQFRIGMAIQEIVTDDGYEVIGGNASEIFHAIKTCNQCRITFRDPAIEFPEPQYNDPYGSRFTSNIDSSPPTLQDFAL